MQVEELEENVFKWQIKCYEEQLKSLQEKERYCKFQLQILTESLEGNATDFKLKFYHKQRNFTRIVIYVYIYIYII